MKSIKYNSVEPYLSHDEYHSISDALGSTGVKTIYSKSVAHYKFQEFVQKVHFDVGTAVHIAVLEPDKFDNEVIKCGKNRMTKEYKELKKNKQSNQVIVTDIEYDKCLRIRDSVHQKSEINKLLVSDNGQSEISAFAKDPRTKLKLKTRPDRAVMGSQSDILLDLKTTQLADEDSVVRSIARYGYHIQEAFYRHVWQLATNKKVSRFVFLFVEKEPPFACCLYEIPESFLDEGIACMNIALDRYKEAEEIGKYPDYPNEVVSLKIPNWAYKETLPPEETILFNESIEIEGDL